MKRRRDRDYWTKLLDEATIKLLDLLSKATNLEKTLVKYPLKPLNRRLWGRTRQGNSKGRRLSFARFHMINRVRETKLATARREIAKTQRQVAHYRAMIEQTKVRANMWWRVRNPLV